MRKWYFLVNFASQHKHFSIKSMILRPSDIPGGKHAGDKNIESNHQRSDIMLKHTSED